MKRVGIFIFLLVAGWAMGSFRYQSALHSCIGEISGRSKDLVSHVGALERENSSLRRSVDLLTEHLLYCERNQALGCIRGAYYPNGQ
jgi:hypothetical protein